MIDNDSHHPRPLEPSLESVFRRFNGWKETDMQFQIGRIEGANARGLDIVTGGRRLYIVDGSDSDSEAAISADLGANAVLQRQGAVEDSGVVTYKIPHGARLLVKTLRQWPYIESYKEGTSARIGEFMARLAAIDSGLFGITIEDIAITYETTGGEDDSTLTVIPPVLGLGEAKPLTRDDIIRQATPYLTSQKQIDKFVEGLGTQNHAAN